MTLLDSSITSVQNARVKAWAQLLDKKGRDKQGQFIIEGVHLVQEALESGATIDTLVVADDRQHELPAGMLKQAIDAGIECVAVSEQVLAKCTDTLTPQAAFAVLPKLGWAQESLMDPAAPGLVVVVDGIQDPGNLGTIIRSADAVGATGVLLGRGTVDLYNPKTVRSTMGSLFHLPIVQGGDLRDALPQASSQGVAIVTTSLQGKRSCYEYDFRQPVWFVVGNEGQGVSAEVSALATEHILIPMQGRAESLNAAMAATVVLFEAMRQRGVR
ncbi:RNA methyltransferase [Paenibacillus sp. RC67]|uniref:TrmH family RNA methyltransferase n=1 Tax=Paenibacillus sp. RC67 TaxID=3039392 RepID=UPI0024ADD2FB|nr:RNA methyltransferase [Paenibacillus sp. RC67]